MGIRIKARYKARVYSDSSALPVDDRRLYEDTMAAIENNGHVTLPSRGGSWISRKQVQGILFALGLLIGLLLLILMKR